MSATEEAGWRRMDWTVGGSLSSGGARWWPAICRCEIEDEIENSWSRISPLSIFTSCSLLRRGKAGRTSGRVGVDNVASLLPEATRARSTINGKLMEGSSWREREDEIMERDRSEVAFDRRMSETITVLGGSSCGGAHSASVGLRASLPEGPSSEMKR